MGRLIDLTGQTFGRLTVTGLSTADYVSPGGQRHPRWEVACSCGNTKAITGAALRSGGATSCGCFANELRVELGRRNAKTRLTYSGAHARVRRVRGPAKASGCAWCPSQANTWAYLHTDPDELTEPVTLPSGRPITLHYSTGPDYYVPLCKSCHSTFDKRRKAVA